jgi:hypothetical protein
MPFSEGVAADRFDFACGGFLSVECPPDQCCAGPTNTARRSMHNPLFRRENCARAILNHWVSIDPARFILNDDGRVWVPAKEWGRRAVPKLNSWQSKYDAAGIVVAEETNACSIATDRRPGPLAYVSNIAETARIDRAFSSSRMELVAKRHVPVSGYPYSMAAATVENLIAAVD